MIANSSQTNHKILLIDDDKKLTVLVSKFLEAESFITQTAYNGPDGLAAAESFRPDVIILDIMMPGFDGLELLRRLRQFSNVYVIMLTARAEEVDKVIGLSMGADDYMVKPFSPRELVARVIAAIRRLAPPEKTGQRLIASGIEINPASREVFVGDKSIELTKTEFDVLEILVRDIGIVLSREKILQDIWGYDYRGDSRAVDVTISALRKKLGNPELIETVHGVGYKFIKESP